MRERWNEFENEFKGESLKSPWNISILSSTMMDMVNTNWFFLDTRRSWKGYFRWKILVDNREMIRGKSPAKRTLGEFL